MLAKVDEDQLQKLQNDLRKLISDYESAVSQRVDEMQ